MNIKKLEAAGRKAVLQLRRNKLNNGQPFMINTADRPSRECYLEYPDGSIQLVTLRNNEFVVLETLNEAACIQLREKYQL